MSIGPVEYIVIAFPGNRFNGEIVPALQELVDQGTVRILDLMFVKKDNVGNVDVVELEDAAYDEVAAFNADRPDRPDRPGEASVIAARCAKRR